MENHNLEGVLNKIDGVQKVLSTIYALGDLLSVLREDPLEKETLPTLGNYIKDAVRLAQEDLHYVYDEICERRTNG